jgi:excisionase family DNA binding protein
MSVSRDAAEQGWISTGAAARMCGLSIQFICRCADRGEFRCFRVPGSRHRRIDKASFDSWLARHGVLQVLRQDEALPPPPSQAVPPGQPLSRRRELFLLNRIQTASILIVDQLEGAAEEAVSSEGMAQLRSELRQLCQAWLAGKENSDGQEVSD